MDALYSPRLVVWSSTRAVEESSCWAPPKVNDSLAQPQQHLKMSHSHLRADEMRSFQGFSKSRKCQKKRLSAAAAAAAAVIPSLPSEAPTQKPSELRPTPAELARTLVEICKDATMSTIGLNGWPLGTFVQFAMDPDGRPVIRLDNDATHTIHLEANGRCSLYVQLELPGQQRPQCTLQGQVIKADEVDMTPQKLEAAWERRFGSQMGVCGQDYELCWLQVDQVLCTLDIGEEEVWISGDDLRAAAADPLRDSAAKIVEDMNRDYWEDIRRFSSAYGGILDEVEDASMTWVDRLGFDLRVLTANPTSLREVRIPFPRPVTDDRDARSTITMMAQLAWERERHYIPPNIPLQGS